jgi:hypothetical protein
MEAQSEAALKSLNAERVYIEVVVTTKPKVHF